MAGRKVTSVSLLYFLSTSFLGYGEGLINFERYYCPINRLLPIDRRVLGPGCFKAG